MNENLFEMIVADRFNICGNHQFAAGRLTATMKTAIEIASESGIALLFREHVPG